MRMGRYSLIKQQKIYTGWTKPVIICIVWKTVGGIQYYTIPSDLILRNRLEVPPPGAFIILLESKQERSKLIAALTGMGKGYGLILADHITMLSQAKKISKITKRDSARSISMGRKV